jgi:hypothetical protein
MPIIRLAMTREVHATGHPEVGDMEQPRLDQFLERAASVLASVVAVLLLLAVVVALGGVVQDMWKPLVRDYDLSDAALRGLDASFLAVILLELVHTTLARGPLSRQVQQFLIIGITSAVRTGLEIAANARVAEPRAVVTSLAINSLSVLVLVVSLLLVRRHLLAAEAAEQSDPR